MPVASAADATTTTTATATTTTNAPTKASAPVKTKAQKHATTSAEQAPPPSEQFAAPQQLNFDAVKALLSKSDPSVPYQPGSTTSQLAPLSKASGDAAANQPHLAPMLRETWMPDSVGDRGNFMDRHEFGIQLHDHF